MPIAYTRAVSPRLAECETTQAEPVDVARAVAQHAAYEQAMAAAGFTVQRLEPLDAFPDGMFVEDNALLLGTHAVILRPGAASRAAETASTSRELEETYTLHQLRDGHVDGGDVLQIGKTLYVGLSTRTDAAGVKALGEAVAPLGFMVVAVPIAGGLHLKSAATYAGHDGRGTPVLACNPAWVSTVHFHGVEIVPIAPGEIYGGNVLRVGATLLTAADSRRTAETLAARGFRTVTLDISEMRKADAALTCMSLVSEPAA